MDDNAVLLNLIKFHAARKMVQNGAMGSFQIFLLCSSMLFYPVLFLPTFNVIFRRWNVKQLLIILPFLLYDDNDESRNSKTF